MSIHKAQGQTLKQCGVLLPEPVFTHGQLYVCASRSSSAGGLRFWLGDPSDGHGYHVDEQSGTELPYTHNVIFPAALSMLTTADTQEPCADPGLLANPPPEQSGAGAPDQEFVELSEPEQHSLHLALYQAYAAAPAESGAVDEALDAHACAPVPCDLVRRAELLGVSRSVWFEISQRSVGAIAAFLEAAERTDDLGGSSSAG